jgi:rod shape-determining protein MreD
MWIIFIVFLLLLLISIQTTFFSLFAISGIVPDLVLIFAVYCGIKLKNSRGAYAGLIAGFIQDCFSGGALGFNTLSKSLIGYVFSLLKDKIMVEGIVPICFFIFISSVFDSTLFFCIQFLLFRNEWGEALVPAILGFSLYNAVIGPLSFWAFEEGKRWFLQKTSTEIM